MFNTFPSKGYSQMQLDAALNARIANAGAPALKTSPGLCPCAASSGRLDVRTALRWQCLLRDGVGLQTVGASG